MNVSEVSPAPRRMESLDGLRGAAAVSVMVSHVLWSHPAIAEAVRVEGDRGPLWVRILTYTPCHLPWLAKEAVVVFFVLSGFVLARPYLAGDGGGYRKYYASRFIRLLLPCWAAVGLAYLCGRFLYPDSSSPIMSWWLRYHTTPAPLSESLSRLFLVNGIPPVLPPLWSLRWELLFSMALPAYVAIARRSRSRVSAGLVAAASFLLLTAGTAARSDVFEFMPMFMLGVLLNGVVSTGDPGRRALSTGPLAVASILLLCIEWYARGLTSNVMLLGVARVLSVVGAVGTVFSATVCPTMREILSQPAILWLGRRSFSLYLVHFPFVMAAALLSGGQNIALTLLLGVPSSLLAADLFFRWVELPSLRLATLAKRFV